MSSITEKWTNIKNLFALIIGIDNYPHVTKLKGAVSDANRFQSFLQDQVKVGNDRIINLRDDQATRKKIEDAFCSLWETDSIACNDPIVIYFAGHGCKIPRPPGWEAGGRNEIEGIFPYDVQPDEQQETNKDIFPIPDRTIGSWLNILSFKKGNNITVIFDCCHSASGARGHELTRAETFKRNLPDGLDKDYFKLVHDTVPPKFPNQHSLSHVFLAACGADEFAMEVDNKGKFTTALLDALDKPEVDELTYAQFMKGLRGVPGQTPQCEGHLKNRILFSNIQLLGWGVFPVTKTITSSDEEIYRIDAGSIHGIHKNSIFNMYESAAIHSETNHPLCKLRAVRVYPLSTDAVLMERPDAGEVAESGFARQRCSGKALTVHFTPALRNVLTNGFGSPDITHCVRKDEKIADLVVNVDGDMGMGHPDITLTVMEVEKDADFIVDADSEGKAVFMTNLSLVTNHGFTRLPDVVQPEPETIVDVLRAASHWTQHLDIGVSTSSNLLDKIEIEFCSLDRTWDELGGPDLQPRPFSSITKNMVSLTVSPEKEDMYGIILRNNTHVDFHVSIVVFDIDSLAIQPFFAGALGVEGKGHADPSLRKGSYLTIGFGNGGGFPLMFAPPEGGINVTILKLYFTSMPMDFGWLEQESPFMRGGERGARPPGQVKQFLKSQGPLGATTTFAIVQRAPES